MRSKYELPFEMPETIGDFYITFPYGAIKGSAKQDFDRLLCDKYINCCFDFNDHINHFCIVLSDPWWETEQVMSHQVFRISKETIDSRNMDVVQIIKRCLSFGAYVCGVCNRSYIENDVMGAQTMNYIITGYDDKTQMLSIRCYDLQKRFHFLKIDYKIFMDALYDLPRRNVEFDLWKYNQDLTLDEDLTKVAAFLEDYVNSRDSKNHKSNGKVYGISAFEALLQYFCEEAKNFRTLDLRYLRSIAGHKNFMKSRCLFLLSERVIPHNLCECADKADNMGRDVLSLGQKYNETYDVTIFAQLRKTMQDLICLEREYLPDLLRCLRSIE